MLAEPKKSDVSEDSEDELTNLTLIIKRDLESGQGMKPETAEMLLEEIQKCQKRREKHELVDLIITLIYGVLRDIQSMVIFMEGTEIGNKDTSEKVSSWVEFISGIISAMYTCAILINSYQARKVSSKKAELLTRIISEQKDDLPSNHSASRIPEPGALAQATSPRCLR